MVVRFVVSFSSPEEGKRLFRNVVWCWTETIEKVQINISANEKMEAFTLGMNVSEGTKEPKQL